MDKLVSSEHINKRITIRKSGDSVCVEDINPPLYILPFVLDSNNQYVKNLYLHKYVDITGDQVNTILGVSRSNFDSDIDIINSFTSRFFGIPKQKIDINRIFYLGETSLNVSVFKTSYLCYGVNVTGLIREDEVEFFLDVEKENKLFRVNHYDVMKGHHLDNMVMSSTFQLVSYFMV